MTPQLTKTLPTPNTRVMCIQAFPYMLIDNFSLLHYNILRK